MLSGPILLIELVPEISAGNDILGTGAAGTDTCETLNRSRNRPKNKISRQIGKNIHFEHRALLAITPGNLKH